MDKEKKRKIGRIIIIIGSVIQIIALAIGIIFLHDLKDPILLLVAFIELILFLLIILFITYIKRNDTWSNNLVIGILGLFLGIISLIGGIIVLVSLPTRIKKPKLDNYPDDNLILETIETNNDNQ